MDETIEQNRKEKKRLKRGSDRPAHNRLTAGRRNLMCKNTRNGFEEEKNRGIIRESLKRPTMLA
jgi:hypothetical protein